MKKLDEKICLGILDGMERAFTVGREATKEEWADPLAESRFLCLLCQAQGWPHGPKVALFHARMQLRGRPHKDAAALASLGRLREWVHRVFTVTPEVVVHDEVKL